MCTVWSTCKKTIPENYLYPFDTHTHEYMPPKRDAYSHKVPVGGSGGGRRPINLSPQGRDVKKAQGKKLADMYSGTSTLKIRDPLRHADKVQGYIDPEMQDAIVTMKQVFVNYSKRDWQVQLAKYSKKANATEKALRDAIRQTELWNELMADKQPLFAIRDSKERFTDTGLYAGADDVATSIDGAEKVYLLAARAQANKDNDLGDLVVADLLNLLAYRNAVDVGGDMVGHFVFSGGKALVNFHMLSEKLFISLALLSGLPRSVFQGLRDGIDYIRTRTCFVCLPGSSAAVKASVAAFVPASRIHYEGTKEGPDGETVKRFLRANAKSSADALTVFQGLFKGKESQSRKAKDLFIAAVYTGYPLLAVSGNLGTTHNTLGTLGNTPSPARVALGMSNPQAQKHPDWFYIEGDDAKRKLQDRTDVVRAIRSGQKLKRHPDAYTAGIRRSHNRVDARKWDYEAKQFVPISAGVKLRKGQFVCQPPPGARRGYRVAYDDKLGGYCKSVLPEKLRLNTYANISADSNLVNVIDADDEEKEFIASEVKARQEYDQAALESLKQKYDLDGKVNRLYKQTLAIYRVIMTRGFDKEVQYRGGKLSITAYELRNGGEQAETLRGNLQRLLNACMNDANKKGELDAYRAIFQEIQNHIDSIGRGGGGVRSGLTGVSKAVARSKGAASPFAGSSSFAVSPVRSDARIVPYGGPSTPFDDYQ